MRYRNTLIAAAVMAALAVQSCAVPEPADPAWSVYEIDAASLEFEYPSGWSVQQVPALANDPAGGVSYEVRGADGDVIAWLDTGIITDQVCAGMQPPVTYTEYDSVDMPDLKSAQGTSQRFVYHSVAPAAGDALVTYAVVSTPALSAEQAACGLFDYFSLTPSSGGRFAGVVPPDEGSDAAAHLEKAAAYANSAEFSDVKRMLVSLRSTE
ncbi:MAG: hypothetical protein ABTA24_15030 [Arthrobacter sp.]